MFESDVVYICPGFEFDFDFKMLLHQPNSRWFSGVQDFAVYIFSLYLSPFVFRAWPPTVHELYRNSCRLWAGKPWWKVARIYAEENCDHFHVDCFLAPYQLYKNLAISLEPLVYSILTLVWVALCQCQLQSSCLQLTRIFFLGNSSLVSQDGMFPNLGSGQRPLWILGVRFAPKSSEARGVSDSHDADIFWCLDWYCARILLRTSWKTSLRFCDISRIRCCGVVKLLRWTVSKLHSIVV